MVMLNEQYDWWRISTETCLSMRRKERELRLTRFLQHQHGYWDIPFGLSTGTSHTEEEQHDSNVSLEVHADLRFSRCSRWLNVWCHRIEKLGGFLVVAKGAPRTFRSMCLGRAEESGEHLVVNEIGHVVRVRTLRRCVEIEHSGPDVVKLTATPSKL